jgi:hypothetical protein
MAMTAYQEIKDSLRRLYLDDNRPWFVGFSSGKDRDNFELHSTPQHAEAPERRRLGARQSTLDTSKASTPACGNACDSHGRIYGN